MVLTLISPAAQEISEPTPSAGSTWISPSSALADLTTETTEITNIATSPTTVASQTVASGMRSERSAVIFPEVLLSNSSSEFDSTATPVATL